MMVVHSERAFDGHNSAAVVWVCRHPTPYPESDPTDSSDDLTCDVRRGGPLHPPGNPTVLDSGSLLCSTVSHDLAPLTPKNFANPQIEQPCHVVPQPLTAYTIPESSAVADPELSACRRLISRAFVPREIISLIEAILTNEAETDIIDDLRGEDAQTFIDLVHGVRLQFPFPGHRLIFFAPSPTPSLFVDRRP